MNELLFFVTIVINFTGILIAYKLFGKVGLFVWAGLAAIATNIEVTKCVDMFGLSLTLGNVIYSTTFLATDILSERYGSKDARKAVWIGFFCSIMFTVIIQMSMLFVPNDSDFVSESMATVFGLLPRLCLASMVAYLTSNLLDTYLYQLIKSKCPKHLWLRNNAATLVSQFVDNTVFTAIAWIGVFDLQTMIELWVTSYIIKFVISLCDTPFLYIARRIQPWSDTPPHPPNGVLSRESKTRERLYKLNFSRKIKNF